MKKKIARCKSLFASALAQVGTGLVVRIRHSAVLLAKQDRVVAKLLHMWEWPGGVTLEFAQFSRVGSSNQFLIWACACPATCSFSEEIPWMKWGPCNNDRNYLWTGLAHPSFRTFPGFWPKHYCTFYPDGLDCTQSMLVTSLVSRVMGPGSGCSVFFSARSVIPLTTIRSVSPLRFSVLAKKQMLHVLMIWNYLFCDDFLHVLPLSPFVFVRLLASVLSE